jgi:hypothetical protein
MFRIGGAMDRLRVMLSPQKLSTIFQVSKVLVKAVVTNKNVGLLTPLKRANEQFTVNDMLPEAQ